MIIARIHHLDDPTADKTAYLCGPPFAGDTIAVQGKVLRVIRRTFLDLGPDYSTTHPVTSIRLEVRTE